MTWTCKAPSCTNLAQNTLTEVIELGRIGYLVEYPVVVAQPASAAAAAQLNLRPYVSKYAAESIINWKMARVNNVMQPVLVVLMEEYELDGNDGFESKCAPQIRALQLTPDVRLHAAALPQG
jgi:hypothetical protein